MKAINPAARTTLKAYLEVFINNLIEAYKDRKVTDFTSPKEYLTRSSKGGQLKPFHSAIIPPALLRINEFERGFSTRLGTTFEECARIIGEGHHKTAKRAHIAAGEVSVNGLNEIERQVRRFEHAAKEKGQKPSIEEMVSSVISATGGDTTQLTVQADVYFMAHDGTEYFFEIKSPQPNKGQCLEILQRILRFHLVKNKARPEIQAYFAMGYNPYGPTKDLYNWSFAKNYFPFQEASLIGQEFWNVVGGPTTFEELLDIYREVGREKAKFMLDSLAFGF